MCPPGSRKIGLDSDEDFQTEVTNQALALIAMIRQIRTGEYVRTDADLEPPRKK